MKMSLVYLVLYLHDSTGSLILGLWALCILLRACCCRSLPLLRLLETGNVNVTFTFNVNSELSSDEHM